MNRFIKKFLESQIEKLQENREFRNGIIKKYLGLLLDYHYTHGSEEEAEEVIKDVLHIFFELSAEHDNLLNIVKDSINEHLDVDSD